MLILNFSGRKFWLPLEGKGEVTKENIQALLDDHTAEKLKQENLIL